MTGRPPRRRGSRSANTPRSMETKHNGCAGTEAIVATMAPLHLWGQMFRRVGGDKSISHNSSADSSVNFAARSPSATGLYWPSPSEMLLGVVLAVFLFFSAFLPDVFTEDESDVKTGAGPTRPETLGGGKNDTVDTRIKPWLDSLEFFLRLYEIFLPQLLFCHFPLLFLRYLWCVYGLASLT